MSASAALLQGQPDPTRVPPPATERPIRAGAGEPILPVWLARGIAFTALTAWGALHWMAMLEPAEPARLPPSARKIGGVDQIVDAVLAHPVDAGRARSDQRRHVVDHP